MELKTIELQKIVGGASIWNATFLNAAIRGFQFIYGIGQAIGSAITRSYRRNYC